MFIIFQTAFKHMGIEKCIYTFNLSPRILNITIPVTHQLNLTQLRIIFSHHYLHRRYGRVVGAAYNELIASASIIFNSIESAEVARVEVIPIKHSADY